MTRDQARLPAWPEIEALLLRMAKDPTERAMVRHLVGHTASIAPDLTGSEILWELFCIANLIGPQPSELRAQEGRLAMT